MTAPQLARPGTPPVRWTWRDITAWNRRDWLAVAAFAAVVNLLMLAPTLYMLQIYDRVMVSGSLLTLTAMSLVTLFFFCLMAAADWFRSRVLIRIGLGIDMRLAPAVFQAAYRQRLAGQPGQAAQGLTDLTQVRQFLTGQGLLALLDAPWIPLYVGVLFLLHPVLGMTAIAFGLLQLGLTLLSHRGSTAQAAKVGDAARQGDSAAAQLLRSADVIVAMGMGPQAQERWRAAHAQALAAEAAQSAHHARWSGWSKWLRYTQQSAALGVGAWLVIRGEMTAGAMIAGNVLTNRALTPLDAWAQTWNAALAASQALGRLQQLLGLGQTATSVTQPVVASAETERTARLASVQVRFPPRPAAVLDGVDLDLRRGQVTLLQGRSGSGKTTLARVVLGVVAPDAGQVRWWLDGHVAADAIGYLPQSVDLFDGTIAQNIARFGPPDSRQVIEAARLVGLHETIQRLPMGYDTPVGAGGMFLSGGQRQRVALARAVYGLPALVVLDEPNSHLDAQGEAALLQALDRLRSQGSAVLVISHRAGVQAVADQIVTLQGGRATVMPASRPSAALAG